jgi:uncharacterized glyoxalase superfamily protein PhnB
MTTKSTPPGWPRISSAAFYQDPARAIDWLCRAFGFEVRLKVEGDDGAIVHSELTLGDGVVMVGDSHSPRADRAFCKSPRDVGGANTQTMMVYVDDVDAHCARARAAGANIVTGPADTDYGADHATDRGYECEDLEGHHWWFYQRLAEPRATRPAK